MAAMAAMALLAQPCSEEDGTSLPLQVLYGVLEQLLYLSILSEMEEELGTAPVLLKCQHRLDV